MIRSRDVLLFASACSFRSIHQIFSWGHPIMCDKPAKQPHVRRSTRNINKTLKYVTPNRSRSKKAVSTSSAESEVQGCKWAQSSPDCINYHDVEWGTPLYDDSKMFEFLLLETFQAGLNWLLILRKRENFRESFHSFDVDAVAAMTEVDVARLVQNAGIIRHAGKIRAAIGNANAVVQMRDVEGVGLSDYFWKWVDYTQIVNTSGAFLSRSELSDTIAKDLKKRGFKFIGSIVIYSHLQAVGIINDHHPTCPRFEQVKRLVQPNPTSE